MVPYPRPFKKEIKYFWGYKNHILSRAKVELPVSEITKKANVPDTTLLIPCLKEAQKIFSFPLRGLRGVLPVILKANPGYIIKSKSSELNRSSPAASHGLTTQVIQSLPRECPSAWPVLM